MRILRQKVFVRGVQVRKVASTAARDANFFADLFAVVDDGDAAAAHGCDARAHHARSACANYDYISLYDFRIHGQGVTEPE